MGNITADNGTVQMTAVVEPADAMQAVVWMVENGTGRASIDVKGVLKGLVNGTVTVKAISKDGTEVEGKTTVAISGQVVTMQDITIIKNGYFEQGNDGKLEWGAEGSVFDSWLTTECTTKTI